MAAARRVGNSIRCDIQGCDHTLGLVEHGPILRDGSAAVNLILASGFHPDIDGVFRLPPLKSHGKGLARDVWAIQQGSLVVALAPLGARVLIVCPGCRTEAILDVVALGLTPLDPDPVRSRAGGQLSSGVELAFPDLGRVQGDKRAGQAGSGQRT